MAVPAHDKRDFEFAKKYGLGMRHVIAPSLIDTTNPPQQGKQDTFREIILAIVYDPRNKKYLTLKWKNQPWTTFVTGGIEKNESALESAKREILEETGYKNIRLVRSLGMSESFFYAAHKGVNRRVHVEHFLFELVDDARVDLGEVEKANYDVQWLSTEEISKTKLQHVEFNMLWKRIQTGNDTFIDSGTIVNSGDFTGKNSEEAKKAMTLVAGGEWVTKFKLRDWVFSRQRYWGEPIPVVHCEKCGIVPLPDKELPLKLPKVKNYAPTQNGESPLSAIDKWVNTKCPNCKGKAKRETDTMPNWAGSSWYYLRYTDAKNKKAFADPKNLKYWTPVDWYNGGMEHTTLHLLYSRFWHKFLYDLGLVPTKEPYKKRTSHGLILAEGGAKMSKSVGNVINPDDFVKTVGADTLRIHEMFMGPFDQAIAWDTNSIAGSRRFIERVWKLAEKIGENNNEKIEVATHKTIKKVGEDIEKMGFNTAISSIMILLNDLEKEDKIPKEIYETLLKILAPFAPHVTEELWSLLKNRGSVHANSWPQYDPSKLIESTVRIMIQVNGKVRGEMSIPADTADAEVEKMALNMDEIKKWTFDKEIKKVIVIKNRLVNIVL
jgi:leucyl-tRNA synthetase family protein